MKKCSIFLKRRIRSVAWSRKKVLGLKRTENGSAQKTAWKNGKPTKWSKPVVKTHIKEGMGVADHSTKIGLTTPQFFTNTETGTPLKPVVDIKTVRFNKFLGFTHRIYVRTLFSQDKFLEVVYYRNKLFLVFQSIFDCFLLSRNEDVYIALDFHWLLQSSSWF